MRLECLIRFQDLELACTHAVMPLLQFCFAGHQVLLDEINPFLVVGTGRETGLIGSGQSTSDDMAVMALMALRPVSNFHVSTATSVGKGT
jgi:hypothetical protein